MFDVSENDNPMFNEIIFPQLEVHFEELLNETNFGFLETEEFPAIIKVILI
jgi:hypothetical protein